MPALKQNHTCISRNFYGILRIISGILPVVLLAFCSPKTTNVAVPLQAPKTFSVSGTEPLPDKWWTVFNDKNLNMLVDSALLANFNLETAWQRLRAAQAVTKRESSGLYPDLAASLQGGVDYPQPDYVGGETFRFGLSSDYEVDLWGRIRSAVEAERFNTIATFADYRTAALTLSAEIARTWFQLSEAYRQMELVNGQIETNNNMLALIRARFSSGQIRGVDILRQQQLLEATRRQKTLAETRISVLKHRLNVLLGQPPKKDIISPGADLPELPPLPETGVPSELISRRPDILSAYNRLKAADQNLASAISSKYPRISITADGSVRANNINDLFSDWAYSLSGNIVAPLFRGGALNAEVERADAVKQQLLYEYGETILIAFREVEDALTREKNQAENIRSLKAQLDLAVKANKQLRIEYLNGMSSYLDVLTSLDQEQQLRRDLINARLDLLEYRISLYRALAGGFETTRELQHELEM